MEEDFNDDHLFTEQADSFEESSRYGEFHGPEKQFSASGDDSNDQHFLEEFKSFDKINALEIDQSMHLHIRQSQDQGRA